MSEHTKEPWIYQMSDEYHEGIIIGKHGGEVIDGHFNEANARRIVACVNACVWIPTEQLEAIGQLTETGFSLQGLANLKQQRDELLAAVLAVCCDPEGRVVIRGSDGDRAVLQTALAKLGADKTGE